VEMDMIEALRCDVWLAILFFSEGGGHPVDNGSAALVIVWTDQIIHLALAHDLEIRDGKLLSFVKVVSFFFEGRSTVERIKQIKDLLLRVQRDDIFFGRRPASTVANPDFSWKFQWLIHGWKDLFGLDTIAA